MNQFTPKPLLEVETLLWVILCTMLLLLLLTVIGLRRQLCGGLVAACRKCRGRTSGASGNSEDRAELGRARLDLSSGFAAGAKGAIL